MRISVAVLGLSLLLGSSVASARTPHRARVKRNNFGTFMVNGQTFKVRRLPVGKDRMLLITSSREPRASISLSRTRNGELRIRGALRNDAGNPFRTERMLASLGLEKMRITTDVKMTSKQLSQLKGTIFGRLAKMALMTPPKLVKKPTATQKPTVAGAKRDGPRQQSYQEVATQKGAIQGGVVYTDRYRVVTTPGKDGGKVIHSDGSSVQLEGWRLRRLVTGGPSNSYSSRNLNIRIR